MRIVRLISALAFFFASVPARSEETALPIDRHQRMALIQSAMIYQLTRYIDWDKGDQLTLCIYRDEEVEQELQRLLERKNNHRLAVRDPGGSCDLLYIPEAELRDFTNITAPYKNHQVLFVSDAAHFIDMGGMVALVDREGKIGIELNMQILRAAGFNPNPALIEIATRVIK